MGHGLNLFNKYFENKSVVLFLTFQGLKFLHFKGKQ